jgi:DNA-directed RNA polymerase specialized sigma24 family protein
VAGWPTIERAEDQWLAQALRSGDVAATAHLYDVYAVRLFDYCHVLLRDEEAAALTLLDSMIIAQERIGDLTDPRLFRGWLYAVTREECLRRREQSEAPAERRHAAEAGGLETDEATRRLVHSALLVLNGRQREALDLALRHELEPPELAEVMRMPPQDVSVLVAQARHDLDDAFAAVVVATAGREDCPSVSALAGPEGRRLDAETCGKLVRHITNCPICGARGNRKVATTRLLSAMPYAAIPADLRDRVLSVAVDPRFADLRARIAHRAEPPAEVEPEPEPRDTSRLWPVVVAVTVGVLIIGGILLVLPGSGSQNTSNNQAIASSPGDLPSDDPSPEDSGAPRPSGSATSPTPTPSGSSGTPTATPTPEHSTHGHPQRQPTSAAPPPPGPPPPAQPMPGTLAVSGCTMHGSRGCTVTVSAQGGPVNWSVTGTSGGISASGGGSLEAGQSTGVRVTRDASICFGNGSGSVSFSSGASAFVRWYC